MPCTSISSALRRKQSSVLLVVDKTGSVLPATHEKAVLVAEMEDGRVVAGETAVASERSAVRRLRLQPEAPQAHPEAIASLDGEVYFPPAAR